MNNLKELIYNAHQIEKLISGNNIQDIKYLLNEFEGIPVTPKILQETDLVKAVYQVLKTCPDAGIKGKARSLLSAWKKLYKSSNFQEKCQEDKARIEKMELSNEISQGKVKFERETNETDSAGRNPTQQTEDAQITTGTDVIHNLLTDEEAHNMRELSRGEGFEGIDLDSAPKKPYTLDIEAVRSKCVELLFQALTGSETVDGTVIEMWQGIAKEIEQSIYAIHLKNIRKYKTSIRSRISNLKNPKNPHLRQKILLGEITPQMFAEMSVMDMANEELKHLRALYTTSGLQDHQLPQCPEGIKTNKIRCKRCEKFNCTVTAIARGTLFIPGWVRSGNPDEQMMTFVICNECGEKWYNSGWISV
ncbi:ras-related protein Rab-9A isoform X2 [Pristis pectinata]|nr:ras-related protein Rab-9A isoform X2 [Pristis pectinata]